MTFETILDTIKNAIRGKDVRQAIHDGLASMENRLDKMAGQGTPIEYDGSFEDLKNDNSVDKTQIYWIKNKFDINYFGHVAYYNGMTWVIGREYVEVSNGTVENYHLSDNVVRSTRDYYMCCTSKATTNVTGVIYVVDLGENPAEIFNFKTLIEFGRNMGRELLENAKQIRYVLSNSYPATNNSITLNLTGTKQSYGETIISNPNHFRYLTVQVFTWGSNKIETFEIENIRFLIDDVLNDNIIYNELGANTETGTLTKFPYSPYKTITPEILKKQYGFSDDGIADNQINRYRFTKDVLDCYKDNYIKQDVIGNLNIDFGNSIKDYCKNVKFSIDLGENPRSNFEVKCKYRLGDNYPYGLNGVYKYQTRYGLSADKFCNTSNLLAHNLSKNNEFSLSISNSNAYRYLTIEIFFSGFSNTELRTFELDYINFYIDGDLSDCNVNSDTILFSNVYDYNYNKLFNKKMLDKITGLNEYQLRILDTKISKIFAIPELYFTGDVTDMSKENVKNLKIEFKSQSQHFIDWCTMKWQGQSSLSFDKKNYNIKLYRNSSMSVKDKIDLGWGKTHSYTLKANWRDRTHSRNVVAGKLWGEVSRSRNVKLPANLTDSPNFGAVDGYPVKVFINGKYEGLYTLNVKKGSFMWNMDEENINHACLQADAKTDEIIFRKDPTVDCKAWTIECPDVLTPEIGTSFQTMCNFVRTSTDEEWLTNINTYLDIPTAIDYYLFSWFIGNVESLGRNMCMLTYDGIKWYPSVYDMDLSFGLLSMYNTACPGNYMTNDSLLWERLVKLHSQELYDRYMELRNSVFDVDYVCNLFDAFRLDVSDELYYKDKEIYTTLDNMNFPVMADIKEYVRKRAEYVDNEVKKLITTTN